MKVRVLIVDDEAPARTKIKRYVADRSEFEVMGEADSGTAALKAVVGTQPDLVILDVQMPGLSGVDVLRLLPGDKRPHVIFCTAFDQYAVDAFELSAVDYLLKPIAKDRFNRALDRFLERSNQKPQWPSLLGQYRESGYAQRIALRNLKRIALVDILEIAYVRMEHKLVVAYTEKGRFWTHESLDQLSARLDPDTFFRIHRSTLLNLGATFELEPLPDGRFHVHMKDGAVLAVARGPAKKLRALMGF